MMALEPNQTEKVPSQMNGEKNRITVSVSEFIKLNFHRLESSGLSRRTIYENLKRNGLELGSFKAFSESWRRNAKAFQQKSIRSTNCEYEVSEATETSRKGTEEETVPMNSGERRAANKTRQKNGQGLGLRPIHLPDGTEVEIDEYGAKTFKI